MKNGTTPLQSPTQLWLDSEEHTYRLDGQLRIYGHEVDGTQCIPKDGWEPEQIQCIPTQACVEQETHYIDTHTAVYHATRKVNYALDLFFRALSEENGIAWIRTSSSFPRKRTITDIKKIQTAVSNSYDNSPYLSWHLLSCNPTLWHNTDFSSEESTVDYFFGDSSVLEFDFDTLLYDMLDQKELLVGQPAKRKALYKQFEEVVADPLYGEQGVIYQYVIPNTLVNDIAYISKMNGKVDEHNPDALSTLTRLKTKDDLPLNSNTLQVRLLVPKLLDPEIASQLIVHNHVNMTSEVHDQFIKSIQTLAKLTLGQSLEAPLKKDIQPAREEVTSDRLSNALGRNSMFSFKPRQEQSSEPEPSSTEFNSNGYKK
ncbi:hypothetical protein [Legionella yabuuchiae]|uniref:hypothetical protein n=1 Tax=Legionella yabuuchiae TaxID=376727 RepID=UPI00105644A9|nr:hypothetical protein [Legionella yabuuchiae]